MVTKRANSHTTHTSMEDRRCQREYNFELHLLHDQLDTKNVERLSDTSADKYRGIFKEFVSNTTFHGLRYIIEMKVWWHR